jgi:hypothetical protein
MLVIVPPNTKTKETFLQEANKSRWIDNLLEESFQKEGMLQYLAKSNRKLYETIAQKNHMSIQPKLMNTSQTLALQHACNLTNSGLQELKKFVRHVGGVRLITTKAERMRVDCEVAAHRII